MFDQKRLDLFAGRVVFCWVPKINRLVPSQQLNILLRMLLVVQHLAPGEVENEEVEKKSDGRSVLVHVV